jgi:hypothetical protein
MAIGVVAIGVGVLVLMWTGRGGHTDAVDQLPRSWRPIASA